MTPLYGKKIILMPMVESDFDYLLDIYEEEQNRKLYDLHAGSRAETISNFISSKKDGSFDGWVLYTNRGKQANKIGVIYYLNPNEFKAEIAGALSKKALKGLTSRLRDPKQVTYSEEAVRLATGYCFKELKKDRVEAPVTADNRLAVQLLKRSGFTKEGRLRNFLKIGDEFKDIIMFSMLKEEYKNGNT